MAFGIDDILMLGGSLLGGLFGSKSSKDASKTQANAATAAAAAQERASDKAIAEQRRQFDLIRGDQSQARTAGSQALNFLTALLMPEDRGATSATLAKNNAELATLSNMVAAGKKLTPEQADRRRALMDTRAALSTRLHTLSPENVTNYLTQTPGYQFQQNELQKAIDRRHAATGNRDSGRGYKEMTRWMQDNLTGPTYRNWLSDLSAIAGYGRDANATNAQAGLQTSNAISNILGNQGQATALGMLGAGDARAGGQLGSAAAWNNALNSGMNWLLYRNAANPLTNPWLSGNPGWS